MKIKLIIAAISLSSLAGCSTSDIGYPYSYSAQPVHYRTDFLDGPTYYKHIQEPIKRDGPYDYGSPAWYLRQMREDQIRQNIDKYTWGW